MVFRIHGRCMREVATMVELIIIYINLNQFCTDTYSLCI
uniref:Uncharacterized protein n=1 Tax=Arundo donax TaxID=35708 RepID=A0A0A9GR92_ARUDO